MDFAGIYVSVSDLHNVSGGETTHNNICVIQNCIEAVRYTIDIDTHASDVENLLFIITSVVDWRLDKLKHKLSETWKEIEELKEKLPILRGDRSWTIEDYILMLYQELSTLMKVRLNSGAIINQTLDAAYIKIATIATCCLEAHF